MKNRISLRTAGINANSKMSTRPWLGRRAPLVLAMTFFGIAAASQASAQTRTWNGSVSNSWTVAGNWTPTGVPTAVDDVLIPSGTSATLGFPGTSIRSLTVRGEVTLDASSLTLAAGLALDAGRVNVSTGTTARGLFFQNGSQTVSGQGTIFYTSDGSFSANGSSVTVSPGISLVATGGTLFVTTDPIGSMNVLGLVEARSGNVQVTGNRSNYDGTGTWTGGTWRATAGTIILPALTTVGPNTTFIFAGGNINGFGTVNFNAGTIRLESAFDLTVTPGSTFFNSGTMNLSGGSVFTVQNQEFRQLAPGSLSLQMSGISSTQRAQIVTTGTKAVRLDGGVTVNYTGFAPIDSCSEFILVGGSQRFGNFNSASFTLPSGQTGSLLTLPSNVSLQVRNIGESCPMTNTCDPDFNRDGNADQDDVAALINVIAGGACP